MEACKVWSSAFLLAYFGFKTNRRAQAEREPWNKLSEEFQSSGEGTRLTQAIRLVRLSQVYLSLWEEGFWVIVGVFVWLSSIDYWDLNCLLTSKFRMERAEPRETEAQRNYYICFTLDPDYLGFKLAL